MAEEKKEKWLNYLAISTVLFAVCATLSTFKGGGFSTKSLLSQSKASDQWSFYQSKSIKSYLYDIEKDRLEIQKITLDKAHQIDKEFIEDKITSYSEKVKKYDKEKEEIKTEAQKFEKERDEARAHSQVFGMAVIFLQVSILLSSIAALTKRKSIWYLSMGTGILGILYFLNGFWLFFPVG